MNHQTRRNAALLKQLVVLCVVLVTSQCKSLELPGVYGDNMILLQNEKIPFSGKASPGSKITVSFDGKEYPATTRADGTWTVILEPHAAGGKYEIRVSDGKNERVLRDVTFGEVWLASGQSNMAFPLFSKGNRYNTADGGEEAAAQAGDYPELRLCKATFRTGSFGPSDRKDLRWVTSYPKAAARFSAIGFLFGRDLQSHLKVPVGIIAAAFPGTRVQAWMPEDTLRDLNCKKEIAMLDARDKAGKEAEKKRWQTARKMRQKIVEWKRGGSKGPKPPEFDKKVYKYYGQNFPSTQFNGMIWPFLNYPVRGIIWYQGESNRKDPDVYAKLFPEMVRQYRKRWCAPEPAFVFVQISAWQAHRRDKPLADDFWKELKPGKSGWAEVREAQESLLDLLPNTGMAVSLDYGDHSNIHPLNKTVVAKRLLNEALRICYGESRPMPLRFDHATREGDGMRVHFRNTYGKLMPENSRVGNFTLAGKDGVFHVAEAQTEGKTVLVKCQAVAEPIAVRYAWANYPGDVKLYNKEGLPCGSFRSDKPQK